MAPSCCRQLRRMLSSWPGPGGLVLVSKHGAICSASLFGDTEVLDLLHRGKSHGRDENLPGRKCCFLIPASEV